MNAEQRGAYLSLILYMYANDGKCLLHMQHLSQLTRCNNFEKVWHKIKKKFQINEDIIKHKRVSNELRKAKRLMQAKRKSGLKGAGERWHSHSKPIGSANGTAMANENNNKNNNKNVNRNEIEKEKEKISNTNTNSDFEFHSPFSSNAPRTRPSSCEGPVSSKRRGGKPLRLDKCLRIGTIGKNQTGNSNQ